VCSSVPALPVKQVRKLIPKVWSEDGSKLSKYRKTMELCGERMSTRSSRVPTPQVRSSVHWVGVRRRVSGLGMRLVVRVAPGNRRDGHDATNPTSSNGARM